MVDQVNILIVDDHTLFRQGLRRVLEMEPGFRVVAEGATADQAIELAARHQPDVVVLDISMPGGGLEATARLKADHPQMGIVILTMHEDQEYLMRAVRAGATSYLVKDIDSRNLVEAIAAAREGRPYLHPKVAGLALLDMTRGDKSAKTQGPSLTERETEVLRLVGQGASNREIAASLFISEKTAKNHLTHIFEKLNVSDRTQAALWAVRAGLVSLEDKGRTGPHRG